MNSDPNSTLGIKSAFDPYQDMKEKLHKDLAGKLLATDAVIKQTITQIFRAKVSSLDFADASYVSILADDRNVEQCRGERDSIGRDHVVS